MAQLAGPVPALQSSGAPAMVMNGHVRNSSAPGPAAFAMGPQPMMMPNGESPLSRLLQILDLTRNHLTEQVTRLSVNTQAPSPRTEPPNSSLPNPTSKPPSSPTLVRPRCPTLSSLPLSLVPRLLPIPNDATTATILRLS
jgi:hypothetical protein